MSTYYFGFSYVVSKEEKIEADTLEEALETWRSNVPEDEQNATDYSLIVYDEFGNEVYQKSHI